MDFFQTLAECSVAFAGFAAVHAVLKGGNSARIMHRSFTIVMTGSLTFVLSLLALLLDGFSLSDVTLWRAASGAGVVTSGLGGILFFRSHRRLTQLGDGPQSPMFFLIAALLLLVPIPVLFLNLGGWLWEPCAQAYGVALTMLLSSGVIALLGSFWFALANAIREANRAAGAAESD